MIKLIGNPNPVNDKYGDYSFGYGEYVEKYFLQYADSELIDDIDIIVNAYKNNGYELEPKYAYYAWDEYSQSLNAHWLNLGSYSETYIIEVTKHLLIPA